MPVTREQADRLTAHALDCRPIGAPRWDGPGVFAAIGRVRHLAYPEVAMAVTRAASDPTAETPGVICATDSIHWREKVTPPGSHRPARAGQDCRIHPGEWAESCRACASNRLAGDCEPRTHEGRSTRAAEHAAEARRRMRGEA